MLGHGSHSITLKSEFYCIVYPRLFIAASPALLIIITIQNLTPCVVPPDPAASGGQG